jgi:hypothetical protein
MANKQDRAAFASPAWRSHAASFRAALLVSALVLAMFAGGRTLWAQAPPQIPAARFYGVVTISGVLAPPGTPILAQSAGSGSICGTGVVSSAGSYFVDVQPFGGCDAGIIFLVNGQRADQTAQLSGIASAAVALNLSISGPFPPPPPFGTTVTYGAGWNLVGGPAGTVISGSVGPLYSFQAGDAAYEILPNEAPLRSGAGYWAYFLVPTTVTLLPAALQPLSLPMPYGQLVMIGNPFTTSAVVSGTAVVYTYSSSFGYQATTVLQPGQGAWAVSFGGSVTLSPGPR